MDLSNVELHLIGYASTAKDSLRRAKSLIGLAENNPENSKTLAGCAIILLAVALDQGVKTLLSDAAETISMETGEHSAKTSPGMYLDTKISSRSRIRSLPRVLSDGRLQLDPKHAITKDLEELIQMRNKLAHVDEAAQHLIGRDKIKVEDGRISAILEIPLNPWTTVTIEKVKTFERAVEFYFTEVLFPTSGEITAGTIVIPVR